MSLPLPWGICAMADSLCLINTFCVLTAEYNKQIGSDSKTFSGVIIPNDIIFWIEAQTRRFPCLVINLDRRKDRLIISYQYFISEVNYRY
jgi:hypothetical protein